MAEDLIKINGTRADQYANLYPQVKSLLDGEVDTYANLANIAAAIHDIFGFFWVGFYLVKGDELVLGPFQGPVACTRIPFHKGVCGYTYRVGKTVIVPNVDEFPGHIACASASKSEIVVPVYFENKVILVLDVDSDCLNDFNAEDQIGLEKIMGLIEENWGNWN
jgi:GAF domain-containing protein